MSVLTSPTSFGFPPLPVRKFTVDEYHQMIQSGILKEDDPVELLEGWIVPKMPHNPDHDGTIQLINRHLLRLLPAEWDIRIQSSVTTSDSEPEPDLALVRGDARTFMKRHPGPADVGLIIEVAESSLSQDRNDKRRAYARAKIAVYWIVNLIDMQIEVHSTPGGTDANPTYANHHVYGMQDVIPFVLDGKEVARIPVCELLP